MNILHLQVKKIQYQLRTSRVKWWKRVLFIPILMGMPYDQNSELYVEEDLLNLLR